MPAGPLELHRGCHRVGFALIYPISRGLQEFGGNIVYMGRWCEIWARWRKSAGRKNAGREKRGAKKVRGRKMCRAENVRGRKICVGEKIFTPLNEILINDPGLCGCNFERPLR